MALRHAVEEMIRTGQRVADDAYAEQYNDLCSWALGLFAGHNALEGKLMKMPDAVTQMNPNAGTHRLLARVSYLETQLSLILGIDPDKLLEARMSTADSANPETNRDAILFRIFEHEQTRSNHYLPAQDIAEQTGLSAQDVEYHLEVLERDGYVELARGMGEAPSALLTSLGGWCFSRE